MEQPELSQIEAFLAVAESSSFSAAARRLGTPKSSVSRRVTALEQALGVALLHRTSRSIRLTAEGQAYRESVGEAVEVLRGAAEHLREARLEPSGLVRWTAPAESWDLGLGPVLQGFAEHYPLVQVELELTNRVVDLLREEFDFALRAGELTSSTLKTRRVGHAERWLVASGAFLAQHGWSPHAPLEQLEQLPTIRSGGDFRESRWTLRRGEERRVLQLRARLRVNDHRVALDAALAGLGVALIPGFLVQASVAEGKLQRLYPEWTSAQTPLALVYPANPAPRARALMDFLAEHLAPTRR